MATLVSLPPRAVFGCSEQAYRIFKSLYECFERNEKDIRDRWKAWLQDFKEHHALQPEGETKEGIKLFLDFIQKHYQPSPVSVVPVPVAPVLVVPGSDISRCPDDCEVPGCPECYFSSGGAYSRPVE